MSKVAETSDDKGKKMKMPYEDEYMMVMMTEDVTKVANASKKPQHNEVHLDLYKSVMETPGICKDALMFAICHLLQNKAEGLCFVQMTEAHRVLCALCQLLQFTIYF